MKTGSTKIQENYSMSFNWDWQYTSMKNYIKSTKVLWFFQLQEIGYFFKLNIFGKTQDCTSACLDPYNLFPVS